METGMMACTRCIENMESYEEKIEECSRCIPQDSDSMPNAEVHSRSVHNAYNDINKCCRCKVVIVVLIFLGCLIAATSYITYWVTDSSLNTSKNSNGPECLPTLSRLTGQPLEDRPDGLRQEGSKCKGSNCQTCALGVPEHDKCDLLEQKWDEHFVKCREDDTAYCLQCGDKRFNSTYLRLEETWPNGELTCSTLKIAKDSKCCLLRDLGNKNGDCEKDSKWMCDDNEAPRCTNVPKIMCNCHRNIPLVEEDTLEFCNETTYHHSDEHLCKQRIDKGADNYESCYCYNNKETVPAPNLQRCTDLKR